MGAGTARTGDVSMGSDPRYQAAMRHSRRVRLLRRAIPVGAGLAVLTIAAFVVLDPFRRVPAGMSLAGVNLSGTRVTMELPKLTGFKRDMTPYEVTAKSAAQDIRNPTLIELKEMTARLGLDAKGAATLEASTGVYDSKEETLDLRGEVRVRSDQGYDARLRSAKVEFKPGVVRSREPVHVDMKGGAVEADALDILDSGKRVVFAGRVRTVLQPGNGPASAPGAAGGPGLFASGSRAPIHIAAERLEVLDKEGRAVYSGDVVATQGDTTMRARQMTLLYERAAGRDAPAGDQPAAGGAQGTQVKRIDAEGPVTVVTKDQVAAGDAATFDRVEGKVVLAGQVSLSEGPNVTRGERLVYDTTTGVATIAGAAGGGRITSVFVPGAAPAAAAEAGAPATPDPAAGGRPGKPARTAAKETTR